MFGPKKTTQRSRAGSQISTMSSSMSYLVVKVGLGGFQGKFKLLGLGDTFMPLCVWVPVGVCVWCVVCVLCVYVWCVCEVYGV